MKQRCFNPKNTNFKHYGGRGITMCDRWRDSFSAFALDVGQPPTDKHTVDRRDNALNYGPDNFQWATMHEQSRNRRDSRIITINGVSKNITDWRRQYGIPCGTLYKRLARGMSIEDALEIKHPRHL